MEKINSTSSKVLMPDDFREQVEAVNQVLGLPRYVIEKDYYITKLLHALSEVENDYYRLVFQGGTCLSKAHDMTRRISEDSDFRIEELPSGRDLARSAKRSQIRHLRKEVISTLQDAGFQIDQEKIRVRDEGKFTNLAIRYPSTYELPKDIKPYLKVDLFLADVKTPTQRLSVTTLIQKTLGEKVDHPIKQLDCVSVVETAAEKWIGLTRRIATIKHRPYYNDTTLVRHVYDLYQIQQQAPLDQSFHKLVNDILITEIGKFKTHNPDYGRDPFSEIRRSFEVLETQEWRKNWSNFVQTMVFEPKSVGYDEALNNLREISEPCLTYLEKHLVFGKTDIDISQPKLANKEIELEIDM